jgi:alpha-beta hydrolase superfamily lysophospholipase
MCCVMTYRPKVASAGDPGTQAGLDFEPITFPATDNVRLAGWWIPSAGERASTQTVLLCHGFAADKSKQPVLLRELAHSGFNVLAIDLRAHGASAGQLTTFGDLERRDVLGAVRWLRANHPHESQRISGVGASLGAVALIAAAVDDSVEGRAISAVACYETYDGVPGLTRTITRDYFFPPLAWLVRNVGIHLASAQTGADLKNFNVSQMLPRLWPRPILFIHGENDSLVDFSHAQRLYQNATQPKYYLWLEKSDYDAALKSAGGARTVVKFLQTARETPVI